MPACLSCDDVISQRLTDCINYCAAYCYPHGSTGDLSCYNPCSKTCFAAFWAGHEVCLDEFDICRGFIDNALLTNIKMYYSARETRVYPAG